MRLTPEQFQPIYDRTARPLKAYLVRLVRNPALAEELLQETYFRFLRSGPAMDEIGDGYRSYLFRVASNLATDQFRARREAGVELVREVSAPAETPTGDLNRALTHLTPRERELVWLAYGEGATHREIALAMGLKEPSVRPMLYRARQRLIAVFKSLGFREGMVG